MEIQVSRSDNQARFKISGEINESGAGVLNKYYQELEGRSSLKELVLNFKHVSYISSSGIGQLILFYKEMAMSGGAIRIEAASPEIHELLSDLDLGKIMEISKIKS